MVQINATKSLFFISICRLQLNVYQRMFSLAKVADSRMGVADSRGGRPSRK